MPVRTWRLNEQRRLDRRVAQSPDFVRGMIDRAIDDYVAAGGDLLHMTISLADIPAAAPPDTGLSIVGYERADYVRPTSNPQAGRRG